MAKGYEKIKWRESWVFSCKSCPKTHENEEIVKAHVAEAHGDDKDRGGDE